MNKKAYLTGYKMCKDAALTEGQKALLLFTGLAGGGAVTGATLDTEKPLRGAMIGTGLGAMGHVGTFIKPAVLGKLAPEEQGIQAVTGAVAGGLSGGFLGSKAYDALDKVTGGSPAAGDAVKAAV